MIVNGALNGQRFVVKDGGVRLGRSSSNDIHIPDEELSRNHCLFEAVGDSDIRITDLASANGTLVNGKPLGNDPQTLRVGDLITVGATTIRVVGDQTPPEVRSTWGWERRSTLRHRSVVLRWRTPCGPLPCWWPPWRSTLS